MADEVVSNEVIDLDAGLHKPGYSTEISGIARDSDGMVISRITVEHYGLDYAGLVKVESSIKSLLDTQFAWGSERVAASN